MRTALLAALAALGLSGCSLMIDPNGVEPPKDKKVTAIGACVDATGGHSICGGRASGGAQPRLTSSSHALLRGTVDGGAAVISGANHRIEQGIVSP